MVILDSDYSFWGNLYIQTVSVFHKWVFLSISFVNNNNLGFGDTWRHHYNFQFFDTGLYIKWTSGSTNKDVTAEDMNGYENARQLNVDKYDSFECYLSQISIQ